MCSRTPTTSLSSALLPFVRPPSYQFCCIAAVCLFISPLSFHLNSFFPFSQIVFFPISVSSVSLCCPPPIPLPCILSLFYPLKLFPIIDFPSYSLFSLILSSPVIYLSILTAEQETSRVDHRCSKNQQSWISGKSFAFYLQSWISSGIPKSCLGWYLCHDLSMKYQSWISTSVTNIMNNDHIPFKWASFRPSILCMQACCHDLLGFLNGAESLLMLLVTLECFAL